MNDTTESGAVPLLNRLRRFPDVEAANLQAWDATDNRWVAINENYAVRGVRRDALEARHA